MSVDPYIRLQLDQSFLDKVFKRVESRLDRHEQIILELQGLLRDKADRSSLNELKDFLLNELELKTSMPTTHFSVLETSVDSGPNELEDNCDSRLRDMLNVLNESTRERIETIEARISTQATDVGDLMNRVESVEETVMNHGEQLNATRESVQHIATTIGLFNDTSPQLDSLLPIALSESVNSVISRIQCLSEQVTKLKADQDLMGRSDGAISGDSHTEAVSELDITSLGPYPPMIADWREPPDLPPPQRFMTIGEFVDYVYRMVPKLQAHLTAMQTKIVENATDKSHVERMIEDVRGGVDELREAVEQTTTREEMNDMLEDINGHPAVGRMKCMACGRDSPQVAGRRRSDARR
jgi:chromosome segregation ATPase